MPLALDIELTDAAGARRVTLTPALPEMSHVIGKDEVCAVRLVAPAVSATHAELFCDTDHWCVRDLASVGGTFIDDNRLFATAIRLEIGQRVRLGPTDGGATIRVIAGAAAPRGGIDVRQEVAGFVKQQKSERKRLTKRWKIALPSAGVVLIAMFWAGGAAVVAHRRAALRADPSLANTFENDGATERLAAIMSGEARPEDVNVQQIIKDASFGRTSAIVDAALGAVKPMVSAASAQTPGRSETAARATTPAAAASSVHTSSGTGRSLPTLLAQRRTCTESERATLDAQIETESRALTERRLRSLIDERQQLILRAMSEPLSPRDAARAVEIDARLSALQVDPAALGDAATAGTQIDPAVLERVRQRLIAAMAGNAHE